MNALKITSDYGHVHLGPFYLGWNNNPRLPLITEDCGDEIFGFCFWNFYAGYYSDGKWCVGFLNKYGYLD